MVFNNCYLCRTKSRMSFSTGYFCKKCKKLQDTIAIFGDRVFDVVDNVLMRNDEEKQIIKEADEIKREITSKEYNLRKKNKK